MWQAPHCLGLFWYDLEYTTLFLGRLNPGGQIVGSWTKSQLTTESELQSSHHWEMMRLTPCQTIEACAILANVEADEGGHYWGAKHGACLLWPLLFCTSKQVVQHGLKQKATAIALAGEYQILAACCCSKLAIDQTRSSGPSPHCSTVLCYQIAQG